MTKEYLILNDKLYFFVHNKNSRNIQKINNNKSYIYIYDNKLRNNTHLHHKNR